MRTRRDARERYAIDRALVGDRGDLRVDDGAALRRLAARMNERSDASTPGVTAGELAAAGLLHEIGHRLIDRFDSDLRPRVMPEALTDIRSELGTVATDRLLDRYVRAYPGPAASPEGPVARLEELLLTRIANENPALGPLRELVDDRVLEPNGGYRRAIATLERSFASGLDIGPSAGTHGSLIELLRTPARASPSSLAGQLRYVRDHWTGILGDALTSLIAWIDITIGVLAEEERALQSRFGGPGGTRERRVEGPSFTGSGDEPEAFSTDSAWMPQLVLMAKSTYVWLDQLSRRYGREIRTLDAIPDEELDILARWGVTGLWLIGLWERSKASERIKRMRGNEDAVASAYSLDDYRIADDLGGEAAHADLRDRAASRGIRIASDMVPNHMGIDSRWVIEHPGWFLSLDEPPYPAYRFGGPDLSSDDRVGIVLEDHYWTDTDAAVVFKRFDRATGETRYVYHGNDGTSFPWNDTAQLDFLQVAVRQHVIGVILDVARRFPVIRFDAAMVLARRHIQRLWWPLPGTGGGVPSRAEHAMTQAAFDALMPVEFWREVVDRVAAEVPGTLLLAEAFWMLEGYFVRTLGMHRVYNSAFMHMLRDEDGPGYRRVIRDTLEFDPEILKRYVNFMSNPDEETALEQFGTGDKYFGVATVMATLPGLPMLGHGQVEGFGEKYGMEYRRATRDEQPDVGLVERHEREIFPLLHRRAWFAEAHEFLLYDVVADSGRVDEHVLAFSNGTGPTRSLVVYHLRFGSTSGTIRRSTPVARKTRTGGKRLERRTLAEGLGLSNDPTLLVAFRDARTGLEYLRGARDLAEHGLRLSLDAYACRVFWEFREIHDGSAGQWRRLADRLGDGGVPSLDEAMEGMLLEPVHEPLRAVFDGGHVAAVIERRATPDDVATLEERFVAFLTAVAEATATDATGARQLAVSIRAATERGLAADPTPADDDSTVIDDRADLADRADRAAVLAWLALHPMGELSGSADASTTSVAWFDELRLGPVLAAGLRSAGLEDASAGRVPELVRVLLALPRPSSLRGGVPATERDLLDAWLADETVRAAMGVNTWDGVEWLDRDRFVELLDWAVRLDAIASGTPPDVAWSRRWEAAAMDAGYRLDTLRAALGPRRPRASKVSRERP